MNGKKRHGVYNYIKCIKIVIQIIVKKKVDLDLWKVIREPSILMYSILIERAYRVFSGRVLCNSGIREKMPKF